MVSPCIASPWHRRDEFRLRIKAGSAPLQLSVPLVAALWVCALIFAYVATELKIKAIYAVAALIPAVWIIKARMSGEFQPTLPKGKAYSLGIFFVISIIAGSLNASDLLVSTFTRDLIVISGCYALALAPIQLQHRHVVLVFFAFVAGAMIWGGNFVHLLDILKKFDILGFIMPADVEGEFHMGAVYGIFLGYFWQRRCHFLFGLTFWLSLASGKRIIIAAFFAALLLSWGIRIAGKVGVNRLLGVIGVWIAVSIFAIHIDHVAEAIVRVFELPIRPDRLIMGRNISSEFLREGWLDSDPVRFLLGHGPGVSDLRIVRIASWGNGVSALPHNDYLKLLFDVGLIGYLAYFTMFFVFWGRTHWAHLAILYTIVAHSMDNTLVFPVHLISLGVISMTQDPENPPIYSCQKVNS